MIRIQGFLLVFALSASMLTLCEGQEFVRGDTNFDGVFDLADGVHLLDHLFLGGTVYCRDSMDIDDDGAINLSDPIQVFSTLFLSGAPPQAPFPDCGEDPSPDSLNCDSFALCNLGDAIGGLTQEELDSFVRGREVMTRRFTPEEGLGPFYNTTSCAACHSAPVTGGSAPVYRNFYLVGLGFPGSQSPIPGLPSMALPSYAAIEGNRPSIPDPQVVGLPVTAAHRNGPPFLGVGLFEFVSNNEIYSRADPEDDDQDGISGRFNTDGVGNVGRFGYKLQANFIEAFIRGAMRNQMGITTDPVMGSGGIVSASLLQVSAGFDDPTEDTDSVPDPEISFDDMADLLTFNRLVAPPNQKEFGAEEELGSTLFDQINCTKCHVPVLSSSVGDLHAYTDLLLHDMGPNLADGISMGVPQFWASGVQTTESEFRTQPLWGVSLHGPWLHDGRAGSIEEAILLHGGEGQASRDAFDALSTSEKEAIVRFLEAI